MSRVPLHPPFEISPPLRRVVDALASAGGQAIAVGGCVRDHLLGRASKDVDIEVFGLDMTDVEHCLRTVGTVHAVGRSFAVLKVTVSAAGDTEIFDVALPRRETKTGAGHRGFDVVTAPDMDFAQAALRRDFTINAMGIDLRDGHLLDPHGGLQDLEDRVLRHVSDAFDEDPLRVLRGCQFAARFGLTFAPDTRARCRRLTPTLAELAPERVLVEMDKLLMAPTPSIGLTALRETGALCLFPELEALIDCPQDEEWHPEGDVWIHTLMVVDQVPGVLRHVGETNAARARIVAWGALCHDLGKPATTAVIEGRLRSRGHEAGGVAPTRALLERLRAPSDMIDTVCQLVQDHLKPFQLHAERAHVSDGALRRLALRVDIRLLAMVARADFLGRTTPEALSGDEPVTAWLLAQAERLRVLDEAPKPILQGRDLIARGLKPGPAFKPVLDAAFAAQLDGAFATPGAAGDWLETYLKTEERL